MNQAALAEGIEFPEGYLLDGSGKPFDIAQYRGKDVVLYFYPKDDTPGCTREACNFRDSHTRILDRDAVIFGVSGDSVASHKLFSQKYNLPFPLLSDPDNALAKKLGLYGRNAFFGLLMAVERATIIIDGQGRIRKVFRHVQVDGHVDEVLKALPRPSYQVG